MTTERGLQLIRRTTEARRCELGGAQHGSNIDDKKLHVNIYYLTRWSDLVRFHLMLLSRLMRCCCASIFVK